jgi:hypothetical protein
VVDVAAPQSQSSFGQAGVGAIGARAPSFTPSRVEAGRDAQLTNRSILSSNGPIDPSRIPRLRLRTSGNPTPLAVTAGLPHVMSTDTSVKSSGAFIHQNLARLALPMHSSAPAAQQQQQQQQRASAQSTPPQQWRPPRVEASALDQPVHAASQKQQIPIAAAGLAFAQDSGVKTQLRLESTRRLCGHIHHHQDLTTRFARWRRRTPQPMLSRPSRSRITDTSYQ